MILMLMGWLMLMVIVMQMGYMKHCQMEIHFHLG